MNGEVRSVITTVAQRGDRAKKTQKNEYTYKLLYFFIAIKYVYELFNSYYLIEIEKNY